MTAAWIWTDVAVNVALASAGATCEQSTADKHWGQGSQDCGALIDGSAIWSKASGRHVDVSAKVVFPSPKMVVRINVKQFGSGYQHGDFDIETLQADGTWVSQHHYGSTAPASSDTSFTLPNPVVTTAVRFIGTYTQDFYRLEEIEVYAYEAAAPWKDVSTSNGCRCNEGPRTWGGQVSSLADCKGKCLEASCKQLDFYNPNGPNGWCSIYANTCSVDQNCNGVWSAWENMATHSMRVSHIKAWENKISNGAYANAVFDSRLESKKQLISGNQCRGGVAVWSGTMQMWAPNTWDSGLTKLRRTKDVTDGQWRVGDVITDGGCQ